MKDYIYYYSENDLSICGYLERIEERINEILDKGVPKGLNEVIELWHIRKLVESGCRMNNWSDDKCRQLKISTQDYMCYVAKFLNDIEKSSVESEYHSLYWEYKRSFWEIIDSFKLYSIIDPKIIPNMVAKNFNTLYLILKYENLVNKYKVILREIFITHTKCACILLDKYVRQDILEKDKLHIPSNLTINDKEKIIVKYLNSDDPNLNYVRLITQVKDDKSTLMLSPKTKLMANELSERLNRELMSNPRTYKISSSLCVQSVEGECIEPVSFSQNNNENVYTYSTDYIRKCDDMEIIFNCAYLFDWFNDHFMLNLISKKNEINSFEYMFMDKGRYSYPNYWCFTNKNNLALRQIVLYQHVLNNLGKSFESALKYFYEKHLYDDYGYQGLSINLPMENDTWLNKCKNICPEIDNIAKQYNLYTDEGEINEKLLPIIKPIKLQNCKSILQNKYYEIKSGNSEILGIVNCLFNYNMIEYNDKKYETIYDLLKKETCIKYSNCDPSDFEILLKHNIIYIDENDIISFDNAMINILKSIWEYEACSYWHHNNAERRILDDMKDKGWLVVSDNLFTKPEQDYLSYYLDNTKFTNGFAYRNLYSHGSNTHNNEPNHNKHIGAYNIFLIILIILIMKIDDDLRLAESIFIASEYNKYVNKKIKDCNEF